jgi:hypothetical protein
LGIPSYTVTDRTWLIAAAILSSLPALAWSPETSAYRPFDGTDAAVAETGQVEIELGPAQYLREGPERTLVAPAVTLNYGLAENWEAVLETQVAHHLSADARKTSLVDSGAFLKRVLREGGLQDKPGPSIATEFGVLLPDVNGEPATGASVAGIVSQRWLRLTLHLNVEAALSRQHHRDLFLGAIVEGPQDWIVRPVGEVFREREVGSGTTMSGLVGAIWRVRENVSIDVGLRGARVDDHALGEVRAGVTFGFPIH